MLLDEPLGDGGGGVGLQDDAAGVQVQMARVAELRGRGLNSLRADLLADAVGGLLGDLQSLEPERAADELLGLGLADVAVGPDGDDQLGRSGSQ